MNNRENDQTTHELLDNDWGFKTEILQDIAPYFEPGDLKRVLDHYDELSKVSYRLSSDENWKPTFINHAYSVLIPFSSKPFTEYQHLYNLERDGSRYSVPFMVGNKVLFNENIKNDTFALHFAALAGNLDAMRFLMAQPYNIDPKLEVDIHPKLGMPLHWAARAGKIDAMHLLLDTYQVPAGLKSKTGQNALHWAIKGGQIAAADILISTPHNQKIDETMLLTASQVYGKDNFYHFLRTYPAQVAACWKAENINGYSLANYDRNNCCPSAWLREELTRITESLVSGNTLTDKEYELLEEFSTEWKNSLLRVGQEANTQAVSQHKELFAGRKKLELIVSSLSEMIDLQAFVSTDQPLSFSLFNDLLSFAKRAYDREKNQYQKFPHFSSHIFSQFYKNLQLCHQRIPEAERGSMVLNPDVVRTIHVIINDYERSNTSDDIKTIDAILAAKLLATSSLSSSRPKPETTSDREINEGNYLSHLDYMKEKFLNIALKNDVRETVNGIIFPGILHLIEHKKSIIDYMMAYYAEHGKEASNDEFHAIYYLVPGTRFLLQAPPEDSHKDCLYLYSSSNGNDVLYSIQINETEKREGVLSEQIGAALASQVKSKISDSQKEIYAGTMLKAAISAGLKDEGLPFKPDELPLHSHEINSQNAAGFSKTLDQLLKNFIGAFYLCETAGQLGEFFNRLANGNCLEARTRDTLTWAMNYSEIKSMDEFMQDVIADYHAYMQVMKAIPEEGLGDVKHALDFIMARYQDFPCKENSEYAPNHTITEEGVRRYLTGVLNYESSQQAKCVIM